MIDRSTQLWKSPRVRQFSREIVLASAITVAALIMFLVAREPTEVASVHPGNPSSTGSITGKN